MTTLFISDLHLEDDKPELTEFFFGFIDQIARGCRRLFILGDFFEVWVGDDEQSELQISVAKKLASLAATGAEILLMHGNRDFLLGHDYATQCSARLITDPWPLTLCGKQVLLMHGDTLCTEDTQYMKFRQLARNPAWQQQILGQPLVTRKLMAKQMRQMSEANSRGKPEQIMDVAKHTVRETIMQHEVDILLHGHTHRPAEHLVPLDHKKAKRLVMGDWHAHTWYAKADEDNLQLIKLHSNELK